jgi:hypothetical protein
LCLPASGHTVVLGTAGSGKDDARDPSRGLPSPPPTTATRDSSGKRYDWDDLAQTVLSEVESDTEERLYTHVIIDEGQDFSPVMIRSLAAAIPEDGSLTFFGDMAQQIYGNKISRRTAGLSVRGGDVWKFEEDYRNTKQIAQLALAIATTPYYRGVADLVAPKSPAADGPLPALVACGSETDEMRFVADRAQKLAQTGTVAVLFRDRELDCGYGVGELPDRPHAPGAVSNLDPITGVYREGGRAGGHDCLPRRPCGKWRRPSCQRANTTSICSLCLIQTPSRTRYQSASGSAANFGFSIKRAAALTAYAAFFSDLV